MSARRSASRASLLDVLAWSIPALSALGIILLSTSDRW